MVSSCIIYGYRFCVLYLKKWKILQVLDAPTHPCTTEGYHFACTFQLRVSVETHLIIWWTADWEPMR